MEVGSEAFFEDRDGEHCLPHSLEAISVFEILIRYLFVKSAFAQFGNEVWS